MELSESEMIEAKNDLENEKKNLAATLKQSRDEKLDEKNILLNAQANFVQQTRLLEKEIEAVILSLTSVVEEEKKQESMYEPTSKEVKSYNPTVNPGGTVL